MFETDSYLWVSTVILYEQRSDPPSQQSYLPASPSFTDIINNPCSDVSMYFSGLLQYKIQRSRPFHRTLNHWIVQRGCRVWCFYIILVLMSVLAFSSMITFFNTNDEMKWIWEGLVYMRKGFLVINNNCSSFFELNLHSNGWVIKRFVVYVWGNDIQKS